MGNFQLNIKTSISVEIKKQEMKSTIIKIAIGIVIYFAISVSLVNAQIHSTTAGGLWSNPFTWVGGIIPTLTDHVVINGIVQTANSNESCNNLTIASSGWLKDNGSPSNLWVYGDLTNNGTIETSISYYAIWLWGDLINNGIMDFDRIYLNGTTDQHISCQNNNTIQIDFFYGYSHNRRIIAISDLSFINSEINMNYDTLTIASDKIISLSGGDISSGCFLVPENAADTYTLTMSANAYVRQSSIRNAILDGTFQTADIVSFYGNTVNNGVLQRYPSISSGLNIYGTFLNNGTIQSNFSIQVYADIVNNGIWDNYSVYFNKTEDQYFSCMNGHAFECDYFIEYNHDGRLIALTDAYFVNCEISLNADTMTMASGKNLYLSGGRINQGTIVPENFYEDFTLTMSADAYIGSACKIRNATLEGTILISDATSFYGNTVNNGILQKKPSSWGSANLYDDFLNNGTIQSDFSIQVYGDIINNGIWNNYGINFQSSTDQHFSCLNGNAFEVTSFVDYNHAGKLIALTDAYFVNCGISMNIDTLTMASGKNLYLSGGRINQATIVSENLSEGFTLTMSANAYISEGNLYNATLEGTILTNYMAKFYGNTTNNGVLQKLPTSTDAAYLYDNFLNNGTIQSNLGILIYGDIINNGVWNNSVIYFQSATDQHFSCLNGHPFEVSQFVDYNHTGRLIALTDVEFINTQVSFDDTLTIANGKTLSLSGGQIYQTTVASENEQGSFSLMMSDNAIITQGKTYNAILEGNIQTYGVSFYGNTVNNGTMYRDSYANTDHIKVYGNFVNNGITNDLEGWTTIEVYGDITNNGVWANNGTYLRGTSDQNINIQNQHTITGGMYFVSDIQVGPYQWYFNGGSIGIDDGFTGYDWVQLGFENPLSTLYEGIFFCSTGGGSSRNIYVNATVGDVVVELTAFLEGPFNGTEMETQLYNGSYLPTIQPFNQAPWSYSGGESANPIPNADVVDWVLVELRDAQDPSSAAASSSIARQAAFILKNGSVVGMDGHSTLNFGPLEILNNLFVSVRHRNHCDVMSSDALNENAGDYTWDFSDNAGQAYGGTNAHKEITTGVWGMISGDGNADNIVSFPDKIDVWNNQAGQSGYFSSDYNLNGLVDNTDKNVYWLQNYE